MDQYTQINQICYDENHKPKIYVNKNELFNQIYQFGADINWNNSDCYFEPLGVQKFDINDFFSRTLNSVVSELGISLILNSVTYIHNISTRELEQLVNTFYLFQLNIHENYPIVYVHEDGCVTEVQLSDRLYLQTKYHGPDGDRPFIKENYSSKSYDGRKSGYCFRNKVPSHIVIKMPEKNNMYINLREMLQRIKNMKYEIDYKEIEFIKLLEEF
jgi:hypothetical protein